MIDLRGEARGLGAAFTFLTRLPLGPLASHDPADLPKSAAYFPVVGLVVALIGSAVYATASMFWPATVAVVLAVTGTVLATGAFHEDALADALDGFGGGWTREQVLTIMKDSRVGSYALIGVVLVVAIKIAALVATAEAAGVRGVAASLVAGHVLGRWSSAPLIRWCAYVRPVSDGERPSAGRPFVASISIGRLAAASVLAAAVVVASLGTRSIMAFATAIVVTGLSGAYFRRRIGGITGDALGAANQVVELCVYLALAAHAP